MVKNWIGVERLVFDMNKGDLKDFSWQKYVDWCRLNNLLPLRWSSREIYMKKYDK